MKSNILDYFERISDKDKEIIQTYLQEQSNSFITINTLENAIYKTTQQWKKYTLSKLKTINVIEQIQVINEEYPLEEDIEEMSIKLEEMISELPKEMILSIDEIGYQLFPLLQSMKTLTMKSIDQEKYLTREIKQSDVVLCCNGWNELLKPLLISSNKQNDFEIECFITSDSTNTRSFYTENDFKKWYKEVVVPYAQEVRKKLNTNKKCLCILDEYFEQYLKGIHSIHITPFYLRKNTSIQLNPINRMISPVKTYLEKEFEKQIEIAPSQLFKEITLNKFISEKKLLKGIIEYSQQVKRIDISIHAPSYQPKQSLISIELSTKQSPQKVKQKNDDLPPAIQLSLSRSTKCINQQVEKPKYQNEIINCDELDLPDENQKEFCLQNKHSFTFTQSTQSQSQSQ